MNTGSLSGTPCVKCGIRMTSFSTVNGLACCDWCNPNHHTDSFANAKTPKQEMLWGIIKASKIVIIEVRKLLRADSEEKAEE